MDVVVVVVVVMKRRWWIRDGVLLYSERIIQIQFQLPKLFEISGPFLYGDTYFTSTTSNVI